MNDALIIPVDDAITLRRLTDDDAGALFELADKERAYLREWLTRRDIIESAGDAASFIASGSLCYETNGGFDAGIWFQGHLAGVLSLHPINPEKLRTSIGGWLGREYQGMGVMTKCVCALLNFAFNDYGLKELRIHCAVHNTRSRAVPERLGFRREVIIPQSVEINGQLYDDVVYVMRSDSRSRPRVLADCLPDPSR